MPNHIHGITRLFGRAILHSTDNDNELHLPNNINNAGEYNNLDGLTNLGECNSPLRGTSQTIGAIVRGYNRRLPNN